MADGCTDNSCSTLTCFDRDGHSITYGSILAVLPVADLSVFLDIADACHLSPFLSDAVGLVDSPTRGEPTRSTDLPLT
jgi:hypothetical protein